MKYLIALASAAVSVLAYGYAYGTDPNVPQVLPFILKLNNPALYPGDLYLQSFSSFPSFYPEIMAFLARFLPAEPLHFALYLAVRFFFQLLVYEIAVALFAEESAGCLACLLAAASPLANVTTFFGEDPLVKTALYHTSLAGPLVLASVLWFLKSQYKKSFAALGAVYYISGLPANYLLVMYAVSALFAQDRREMLKGWAVFAALWLPWLVWYLSLKNVFAPASPGYVSVLKGWYPGHYFPSLWTAAKWRAALVWLGLLGAGFYSGLKYCAAPGKIKCFLGAGLAMWALAYLSAEIVPARQLVVLQFFRSDSIIAVLGIVFCAEYARRSAALEHIGGKAAAGLMLLSMSELAAPAYAPFALAYIISLAFLPPVLAGGVAGAAALLALADLFRFDYGYFKIGFALLLFAAAAAEAFGLRKNAKRPGAGAIMAVVLAVSFGPVFLYRAANGILEYKPQDIIDWQSLQRWAERNTPVDARFITPPDYDGFRAGAKRSPAAEWLDGAAMHWAPGFERDWLRRVGELGYVKAGGAWRYDAFGEAEFKNLSAEYRAGYIVAASGAKLAFPVVYANRTFTVYQVTPPALPADKNKSP